MDKKLPVESLTGREQEILQHIVEGLTNQEIADQLYLAKSTIKSYVNQLNSKLYVSNRKALIDRAIEYQLLDDLPVKESYQRRHKNLPRQTTPFIGRDTELNDVHALLENEDIRLLTILAPGGMGKTRLALEATEQQMNHFPDGVYFVPLQRLSDVKKIIPQIADSTGYQFANDGREPQQQVLDFLANKHILLCLDNFEHLLEGAPLLNDILLSAPEVKILVTSRERLNLSNETVYVLHGMQFPSFEISEDALRYDAVQLLVQATQRVKPDWQISEDNLDYVACVCRLTQGMPLAIMLAASWLDVYSLQRICEEIRYDADILETDMRDIPQRQRSIRAVFDYSWQRLKPQERDVLIKMSVFRGGGTPRAVEHITGANPRILQALVNKALISRNQDGRYDIHELLRQYAEKHLSQSGAEQDARNAHMNYYADAMHERKAHLKDHRQLDALRDIAEDYENVLQAWHCAVAQQDYDALGRMVDTLRMFVFLSGQFREPMVLFEETLRQLPESQESTARRVRAKIMRNYTMGHHKDGTEQLVTMLRESLAVAREFNDRSEIAECLLFLTSPTVVSKQSQGDLDLSHFEEALVLAEESYTIYADDGDKFGMANALNRLGYYHLMLGDRDKFYQSMYRVYQLATEIGRPSTTALACNALGVFHVTQNELDIGERYYAQALAIQRQIGNPHSIAQSLGNMIAIAFDNGDLEKVENYLPELDSVSRYLNPGKTSAEISGTMALLKLLLGEYDKAHALAQDAYTILQKGGGGNPQYIVNAHYLLGWTYCATGNFVEAVSHLFVSLEAYLRYGFISEILGCVATVSLIYASREEYERATELLALVLEHPYQLKKFQINPLLIDLRKQLPEKLGEEAYQEAWERGKSLDLNTVAEELLAEFGEVENSA